MITLEKVVCVNVFGASVPKKLEKSSQSGYVKLDQINKKLTNKTRIYNEKL